MFGKHLLLNEETLPVIEEIGRHMPGGFFIYRSEGEGELLYANRAVFDIYGCSDMEDLRALIADQAAGRQLDLSKLQLFPDTPENHWAYDYVATLAGNGLLEGYPDGNFKGDRELTRYEVAAILYRAMTNGAQLTERALKEFAPELNRIRVDTISHHSDGTPSIQRVRVVKGRG